MNLVWITTSKGRLEHLKRTLPEMLKQAPVRLVDYGCPDGSGNWAAANYPDVDRIYVFNGSDDFYNGSRARNMGAHNTAANTWLAFIDADCIPQPGLADAMRQQSETAGYFAFEKPEQGLSGFVCCRREDWQACAGYDESARGYGFEDTQFKWKLETLGRRPVFLPRALMEHIQHPPKLQTQFYQDKDVGRTYPDNVARLTANLEAWKKRKGLS